MGVDAVVATREVAQVHENESACSHLKRSTDDLDGKDGYGDDSGVTDDSLKGCGN